MPFSRRGVFVRIVFLTSYLATAGELAAQPKTPIPDAAAQQTAKKAAGELFAERFKQAKTSAEKTTLATDMMDAAGKVPAGSADQYVLLKIARDVAAGTGDAATALQAVERLLEQFDEPAAELIGDTLLTAARQATTSAQHKAVAEAALSIAGKLSDADQYETAVRLCEAARSSAQRAKLFPLAKELTAQIEETKRQQLLSEDYRKALSVLEDKPTDPAANLAAGRHLCFVKGNWDRGVPMLALGSDAALKAAAIKDLRGANSADEQATIGDAWWDVAEAKQGEERETLRLRAGFWYRQAEPKLAGGLAALKVKQRLAELEKADREIPTAPREAMGARVAQPRLQLPAGAVLLMTFEPDTFTSKDGKMYVADLSGFGNHGIVEGAAQTPAGRAGAAMQFGGKDSIVLPTLHTFLALGLRQVTLSLWFQEADLNGDQLMFDVGGLAAYSVSLYCRRGEFVFVLPENHGGNVLGAGAKAEQGRWHHFAGVWNGVEQRIYVDGQKKAAMATQNLILNAKSLTSEPARIGAQAKPATRSARFFRGLIDEVAIFPRALSDEEIQFLYQFGQQSEPLLKAARTRSGR